MKHVICKTKDNELVIYDEVIAKYVRESESVLLRNKLLGDRYANIDKDLNPARHILLKQNINGVCDFFEIKDLNGNKLTLYSDNQYICIKTSNLSFSLYLGKCEYINGIYKKKVEEPIDFEILSSEGGYRQIPLYKLYEDGCVLCYYDSMNSFVLNTGWSNFSIRLSNDVIQSVYYG